MNLNAIMGIIFQVVEDKSIDVDIAFKRSSQYTDAIDVILLLRTSHGRNHKNKNYYITLPNTNSRMKFLRGFIDNSVKDFQKEMEGSK